MIIITSDLNPNNQSQSGGRPPELDPQQTHRAPSERRLTHAQSAGREERFLGPPLASAGGQAGAGSVLSQTPGEIHREAVSSETRHGTLSDSLAL